MSWCQLYIWFNWNLCFSLRKFSFSQSRVKRKKGNQMKRKERTISQRFLTGGLVLLSCGMTCLALMRLKSTLTMGSNSKRYDSYCIVLEFSHRLTILTLTKITSVMLSSIAHFILQSSGSICKASDGPRFQLYSCFCLASKLCQDISLMLDIMESSLRNNIIGCCY